MCILGSRQCGFGNKLTTTDGMNKRVKTVHINTEISNNLQLISGAKLLNNHFEYNHMVLRTTVRGWIPLNSLNCGIINRSVSSDLPGTMINWCISVEIRWNSWIPCWVGSKRDTRSNTSSVCWIRTSCMCIENCYRICNRHYDCWQELKYHPHHLRNTIATITLLLRNNLSPACKHLSNSL